MMGSKQKSLYQEGSEPKEFAPREANSLLKELTPIQKTGNMKMTKLHLLKVASVPDQLICDRNCNPKSKKEKTMI